METLLAKKKMKSILEDIENVDKLKNTFIKKVKVLFLFLFIYFK